VLEKEGVLEKLRAQKKVRAEDESKCASLS